LSFTKLAGTKSVGCTQESRLARVCCVSLILRKPPEHLFVDDAERKSDLERKTLVLYRKRIREGMYVNTVL
jgi:hypothetical protein